MGVLELSVQIEKYSFKYKGMPFNDSLHVFMKGKYMVG